MTRRFPGRVVVSVLVLAFLNLPDFAAAQAKIRIAIWDFENNAERSWWFWNDMGPAARNHIDTAFSENPRLSEKFSVIEREKLELVMKEQGLAMSGALDPQTAAKVGKILGIKYILTGGIDRFSITRTGGAVSRLGVGGSLVQAEAVINMRFIDTTTAERVVSISAEGEVKKGGGFFKGTSLSREAEWGIASEAIEKASKAVVEKLVAGGYLDKITPGTGPAAGTEGRVIKVEGNRAWINMGSASGIKVGDRFTIVSVGEELIDPDTGAKLGAEEKETGTGEVTEVFEKYAILTFKGAAKAKDTVRKR
jgi:curli biogenesis system outer membrane secretion channel CsgG